MPVSDSGVYGIVVQIAHSIGQLVGHAGRFHKGLQHLTVVVAVLAILLFSLVECLRGREPDLPGISQAVRMQLY